MGTHNSCNKSGGLTQQHKRTWPCGHRARPAIVWDKSTKRAAAMCGKCHAGKH